MNDGSTMAIVVGGLVTVITGFYAIAKMMLNQATKDRDADRSERKDFIKAIKEMATNSGKVATATERGANEARERNGHLGEQTVKLAQLVKSGNEMTKKIVDRLELTAAIAAEDREALTHPNQIQNVEKQTVKQTVKKQIVTLNADEAQLS